MNVYKLTRDYDDPRFSALDFDVSPSLVGLNSLYDDFGGRNTQRLDWEPIPLTHLWQPHTAVGPVQPYNDYPTITTYPAFSDRAVNVLRDFLEPNGELLPVETNAGTYYAYNILTKSTALNPEQCKLTIYPGWETAKSDEYLAFDESRLAGHTIFRTREYPGPVFVTEEFKARVEKHCLNGFYFIKVWPFAPSESYRDAERIRKRERRKTKAALKGQCVAILLSVPGIEATEEEEKLGFPLAEQLNELLVSKMQDFNGEFLGNLECLEPQRKALGIYLVCPDAERLAEAIDPWLKSLNWPHAVTLVKYAGNRFEHGVKKTKVKVKK
jgi:hypothetical protein